MIWIEPVRDNLGNYGDMHTIGIYDNGSRVRAAGLEWTVLSKGFSDNTYGVVCMSQLLGEHNGDFRDWDKSGEYKTLLDKIIHGIKQDGNDEKALLCREWAVSNISGEIRKVVNQSLFIPTLEIYSKYKDLIPEEDTDYWLNYSECDKNNLFVEPKCGVHLALASKIKQYRIVCAFDYDLRCELVTGVESEKAS